MALSGLHVAAGKVGIVGPYTSATPHWPLLSKPLWSESLSAAGTTTGVAPDASIQQGPTVFSIRSNVEAWIAIGPNPDAAANPREVIGANETFQRIVNAGDRLAWRPA